MRIILIAALFLLPFSAIAATTTHPVTGKKLHHTAPMHHPVTGKKLQNSAKPATPAAKPATQTPAAKPYN